MSSTNPTADTSALISRLDRIIAEREDELIRLVGDLVRYPSLLGDEAGAQTYIAGELTRGGVETDVWEIDEAILDRADAGRSGVPFAGRPNVSGTVRGDGSGRSLILNGHIDVVSPEPLAAWTRDPWGAAIEGNRMYGRGACDMKSGVAINIFLMKLFPELGIHLGGDLSIHSVIEEECTGNGALAASLRQQADAAIVTEAVPGFVHAHLGVMWFRVRVTGRSAHAGWAWQGVNAISKTTPIIRALEDLDARLNERTPHPLWAGEHHPINLNIGTITGGDWPSSVPGSCEIHCRLGFYPDQSVAEMRQTIEAAIHEAVADDPWFAEHPPVISYDGFSTRGSIVDLDEPSVQLLHRHHRRVTNEDLGHSIGTAVNDMRYYNFVGVPAGCYGASGGNVHAADEWLDLTTLVPTAQVLAGFIVDWCGVAMGQ